MNSHLSYYTEINPFTVAEDIDFESLGSTIDRLVEKGEDEAEYNAFCENESRKLFMGLVG